MFLVIPVHCITNEMSYRTRLIHAVSLIVFAALKVGHAMANTHAPIALSTTMQV